MSYISDYEHGGDPLTINSSPPQFRVVQLVELTDECIEKIVNKIAEVKPVVRGEWEECEIVQERGDEPIIDEWQSARCSVCGKYHTTPYMYYFDNFNFCPNCGADMRGELLEGKEVAE